MAMLSNVSFYLVFYFHQNSALDKTRRFKLVHAQTSQISYPIRSLNSSLSMYWAFLFSPALLLCGSDKHWTKRNL